MRKFLSFLAVCAVLLSMTACGNSSTPAQTDDTGSATQQDTNAENASFLVLSQNIDYVDYAGENSLTNRTERFRQLVQTYQPDIISTQESNSGLCNIYQSLLGQTYSMIAECPNESGLPSYGTSNTILYRTDRYELLETNTYWLSDTPEMKSKLEGSSGFRSCTWALLKDNVTQREFIVCNTHLDYTDAEIQQRQFQILWELCGEYFSKYPVIITGDFNAEPTSVLYTQVTEKLSDSYVTAAEKAATVDHTFHGFYQEHAIPCRLDYCFYDAHFTADSYRILTDQYDGYVSDHYGILTELRFQ